MNSLFSILALPQSYEAGRLRFNVVFVPRNLSPLDDLTLWGFPDVGAFADAGAAFRLEAKIISGLSALPDDGDVDHKVALELGVPASARPIFEAMRSEFDIDDIPSSDQTAPAVQTGKFIRKYLPLSYRRSFNFTNPRTRDAVIDDTYHCAFKDKGSDPNFKQSSDRVSWGKVYAHCLRHPELAKKVGLVHADVSIEVPQAVGFIEGGWLFVDYSSEPGHHYVDVQADPARTKRYAARIPAMEPDQERVLFAPVLFPVAFGAALPGNYDEPQREAADYNDGFAKIVHAYQPISTNFLQEEEDDKMVLPTKDIGIRLGWDDEQVLIWQNRQLKEDPSVGANQRLDAPLGVTSYHIDVRRKVDNGPEPPWTSLNMVRPRVDLDLGGETIMDSTGGREVELGTEVYPMQLSADQNASYWLPSYFTQWAGKSMVLPDQDAHRIYRIEEEKRTYETGDGVTKPLAASLESKYEPVGLEEIALRYGDAYEFRVRMGDLSGGGPRPGDERIFEAIAQDTAITFKRHVPPNAVRMEDLPEGGDFFQDGQIRLRRPISEYPNVEFSGFYEDVVDKLATHGRWTEGKGVAVGLPDPDVDRVEITVEVKGLGMDHKLSVSGREDYYHLYTVTRSFQPLDAGTAVVGDPNEADPFRDIEPPLELPLQFGDATVIDYDDDTGFGEWPVTLQELEDGSAIILPTARDVRVTLRALGREEPDYYGLDAWKKGKTIQFWVRQAPTSELSLFDPAHLSDALEGYYLQPGKIIARTGTNRLLGRSSTEEAGSLVKRLAQQLNLERRGRSLIAYPGVRAQFGCARSIRHTLAPDGTALTFSTQADLLNHWLVGLHFRLQREWSWDAMHVESFVVMRRKKFSRVVGEAPEEEVGTIELHRTINLQALEKPDRSFTQLVFIDAVEPKKDPDDPGPDEFPDTIELTYRLVPRFKAGEEPDQAEPPVELDPLTLPVTSIPAQEPKLASAGIALSPYSRNERYSSTEARRRFLWLELEEAVRDPNDAVYVRLLAYSPDPLLSDLGKYPELLDAPAEPAIPLDPELIRVIRPQQSNDHAGLNAMTELEGAVVEGGEKPRHYLVPLPQGLHADSDELFGFFTYELRVGHKEIWSTAQGRFGRPLRVTGVQHICPNLFCTVERTEDDIRVVAPYATAVHDGKNVTADPPRSELWALIYAQVKMADDQDYRNILLGERRLELGERRIAGMRAVTELYLTLVQSFDSGEAKRYGTTTFDVDGVRQILDRLGLPLNSPLSVLTVEFLPTNYSRLVAEEQRALIDINRRSSDPFFDEENLHAISPGQPTFPYPLSRDLGQYRILRTSPLVAVPKVCPTDS